MYFYWSKESQLQVNNSVEQYFNNFQEDNKSRSLDIVIMFATFFN